MPEGEKRKIPHSRVLVIRDDGTPRISVFAEKYDGKEVYTKTRLEALAKFRDGAADGFLFCWVENVSEWAWINTPDEIDWGGVPVSNEQPKRIEVRLGEPPEPGALRDAVHVAVIPMIAVREMKPGERLKNGAVDPFLTEPVKAGGWFWLCLFPGTVTDLRHAWSHPAFPSEQAPAEKKRSEADVWKETAPPSFDLLPVPPQE